MKIQRKRWTPSAFEWKADQPGTFRAIFSTLNEIDKDGDVTVPGAFRDGQEVRIAQFGHNWEALPVGKGVINSDDKEAWCDGEFFLDTPHGDAAYKTAKGLGALQQWSYGFSILTKDYGDFNGQKVRFLKSLDVVEVSQVMVGAGNHTRTESIKGRKQDDPPEGSYEDLIEDLTEAVQALAMTPFGGSVGYVRIEETYPNYCIACLVSFDDEGYDETYWNVPYTLDAAGDPVLGTPTEVEQTWQPVAGAGTIETAAASYLTTFKADVETALTAAAAVATRAKSFGTHRVKEGRAISAVRMTQMGEIVTSLRDAADGLDTIITEATPPPKAASTTHAGLAEAMRFQLLMAGH